MMFFRYSQEKPLSNEDIKNNSLFKFFQDKDPEDLALVASSASKEAKQLFEGNVMSLLGQLPNDLAVTNLSLNKETLEQLIFSAMMTGYVTRVVEDKMTLEKCWQDNEPKADDFAIDKQMDQLASEDDDLKGIL